MVGRLKPLVGGSYRGGRLKYESEEFVDGGKRYEHMAEELKQSEACPRW